MSRDGRSQRDAGAFADDQELTTDGSHAWAEPRHSPVLADGQK